MNAVKKPSEMVKACSPERKLWEHRERVFKLSYDSGRISVARRRGLEVFAVFPQACACGYTLILATRAKNFITAFIIQKLYAIRREEGSALQFYAVIIRNRSG